MRWFWSRYTIGWFFVSFASWFCAVAAAALVFPLFGFASSAKTPPIVGFEIGCALLVIGVGFWYRVVWPVPAWLGLPVIMLGMQLALGPLNTMDSRPLGRNGWTCVSVGALIVAAGFVVLHGTSRRDSISDT